MKTKFILFFMCFLNVACTAQPDLSGEPNGLSPMDQILFRGAQIGAAKALAENCSRFKFDKSRERITKKSLAQSYAFDPSKGNSATMKSGSMDVANTMEIVKNYIAKNGLYDDPSPSNFCIVAKQEKSNNSEIGKYLLPI